MTFTTVTPPAHVVGAQLARDVKVNADGVGSPTEVLVLTLTVVRASHPAGTAIPGSR